MVHVWQEHNGLRLQAAVKCAWFKYRNVKTIPVRGLRCQGLKKSKNQFVMFTSLHLIA